VPSSVIAIFCFLMTPSQSIELPTNQWASSLAAPVIYPKHLLDPPAEHAAVKPASLDNSDNRTQSE
jgi:hypothetical protein